MLIIKTPLDVIDDFQDDLDRFGKTTCKLFQQFLNRPTIVLSILEH